MENLSFKKKIQRLLDWIFTPILIKSERKLIFSQEDVNGDILNISMKVFDFFKFAKAQDWFSLFHNNQRDFMG